jgi:tetratricopeptide (TPR) repeat protein
MLELDPSNADGWGNLAFEHLTLGDPAGAIGPAEQALRLRPDDVISLTNLLVAQWGIGDVPSARRSFERLKAVDPSAAASLAARTGLPFR